MRLQRVVKTGYSVKMLKLFDNSMFGQSIKITVNRCQTD